jgi:hypothetical protein
MVPNDGKGAKTVAKASTKKATAKSPGAQKIQAGPSGKMHKLSGAGPQAPSGVTNVTKHAGKGAPFPKGGPSGQMHGFAGVKPQKSGRSSQS